MVGPYGLEHRCNSADYPTLSLRSAAQEGNIQRTIHRMTSPHPKEPPMKAEA